MSEDKFHHVATVNQEFILEARKNDDFKNILNECDLNVADSFGLNLAFWKRGERLKCRFPGADLMDKIIKIAEGKRMKVFLAANKDGLSSWQETRTAILKKYPSLEISGEDIDKNISSFESRVTYLPDRQAGYDIMFCNFGAPYQERFIYSLKKLESAKIRLAVGVGGSFDYLTGKVRRAPRWIRIIGMEWLWRLVLEPRYRIKRIWNAVAVFSWRILFNV